MENEITHIWEHALGVSYPGDLDVELILSESPALILEEQIGGITLEVVKEGAKEILILEETTTGLIEFSLDNNHDIEVSADGTIIYHPTNTYLPQVKTYLEHPNNLTEIYLGDTTLISQLLTVASAISVLNADLLDGHHASFFAPIDSPSFTGPVSMSGNLEMTSEGSQIIRFLNGTEIGVNGIGVPHAVDFYINTSADGNGNVHIGKTDQGIVGINYDASIGHDLTIGHDVTIGNYASSPTYFSGFAGSGWRIDKSGPDYNLTVDNLTVRKKMKVYELEIAKISSINGGMIISAANGTAYSVNGNNIYFDTDNGRNPIQFAVNDFVRAQVWTGRGIDYYLGRVTQVVQSNTLGSAYITVTHLDGTPWANADLVQVGNASDTDRQSAIYLTASDDNNPYIDGLAGLDDGSFAGKQKFRLGNLTGITDTDLGGALNGYGLYATNVYLKGKIQIASGSAGYGNMSDKPTSLNGINTTEYANLNTAISNAATALSNANTANANATTALNTLTDIASDSVLSMDEKPQVKLDYDVLIAEQSGIDTKATSYGITTEKTAYDNAVTALTSYLTGLTPAYSDFTQKTTIVGSTFRSKFSDVYTTRQALLNAIYTSAKTLADNAQTAANNAQGTANTALSNAATALSTANTANNNATTALNGISDVVSDNILSMNEKPQCKLDYDVIIAERTGIDAKATLYSITTEKTAYDNAVTALTSYLTGLTPIYTDFTQNTIIVGTTFRTKFQDVYTTRQTLLNKIYDSAKALADAAALTSTWGGVSGTGKPQDNANYTTNTNQLTDGANLGGTATWSGVSGAGKPADNATAGATWRSNIANMPGYTGPVSGKGLFMNDSYMGYYNYTDYPSDPWRSYIDSLGNARFVGVTEFGTAPTSIGGGISCNIALKGNEIWENSATSTSSLGYIYINRIGLNGGTSTPRGTLIGDGQGNTVTSFTPDHIYMYQNTTMTDGLYVGGEETTGSGYSIACANGVAFGGFSSSSRLNGVVDFYGNATSGLYSNRVMSINAADMTVNQPLIINNTTDFNAAITCSAPTIQLGGSHSTTASYSNTTCTVDIKDITGFSISVTPKGNKIFVSFSVPIHNTTGNQQFTMYITIGANNYFNAKYYIATTVLTANGQAVIDVTPNTAITVKLRFSDSTAIQYLGSTGTYGLGMMSIIDLF